MQPRFTVLAGLASRTRFVTGVGLVVLACAVLLARLPGTVSRLNGTAKHNNSYTTLERALAAADSFGIDNGFVVAAMEDVPARTTFAVVTPSVAPTGTSPETFAALPPYLQNLLLPSRLTSSETAAYILCYLCDRRPFHDRITWIWSDGAGRFIGRAKGRS